MVFEQGIDKYVLIIPNTPCLFHEMSRPFLQHCRLAAQQVAAQQLAAQLSQVGLIAVSGIPSECEIPRLVICLLTLVLKIESFLVLHLAQDRF